MEFGFQLAGAFQVHRSLILEKGLGKIIRGLDRNIELLSDVCDILLVAEQEDLIYIVPVDTFMNTPQSTAHQWT